MSALAGGCVPDWDVYDPRLGGATGNAGGAGGGVGGAGGVGGVGGGGGVLVCEPGTAFPCYDGPAGTDGVGVCVVGVRTCDDDGAAFGPCEGQVMPSLETCETPDDEDCDGQTNEEGVGCSCAPSTEEPCYTGPEGTEGMGVCVGGVQTCNAEGTGFGACEGQVTPVAESCATGGDDDCDGVKNDHCAVWSKSFGSAGDQQPWGVAVDASGNIVLTGRLLNTVNFGGADVLSSAGGNDVFLAKLSPTGAYLWSKRFGDVMEQDGYAVAVDAMGNIVLTGSFQGSVAFSASPALVSAGGEDLFVAKFDAAGTHLWSKSFGDASLQRGRSIATDAAGNVIVTGRFSGTVDFGGAVPLTSTDAMNDGFLLKLDAAGAYVWAKAFGGAGEDSGQAVAVDSSSNIFVTGYFDDTITFGGPTLNDNMGWDVFVAKLTPAGAPLWTKAFGSATDQEAHGIALDKGGNAFVLGEFEATIDFGGGVLTSAGNDDIFVAKLAAATGAHIWSKRFGDASDQEPGAIAVDSSGDVLITGNLEGTMNFGGSSLTSIGQDDVFLAKLNGGTGGHHWSRRFGNASDQDGRAVATDATKNVIVTGKYQSQMNLGPGTLTSIGGDDIFLAKLPP